MDYGMWKFHGTRKTKHDFFFISNSFWQFCSIEETKEKKIKRKKETQFEQNMGRVGLALLLVMVACLPTLIALDTQNCWLSQILRYVALFMLAYTCSCPIKPSHFLILIFHLCIRLDEFIFYCMESMIGCVIMDDIYI